MPLPPMDFSIVGKSFGPFRFEYDWRRAALYALACGAGEGDLDLVLDPKPVVLPTFADVVSFGPVLATAIELKAELLMRLHVAQKTQLHRPFSSEASLETTCTIRQIYDQGTSALVIFETQTTDAQGPLADVEWHVVYRAYGKFGGPKPPDAPSIEPPNDRAPDHAVETDVAPTTGLLYRLVSEDWNPIHADPQVAKRMGFPKPILHGVCTFGHVVRAALGALGDGAGARRVSRIEGRFVKPVYPGDKLVTEVWRSSDDEGAFVARAKARNELVIACGRLGFTSSSRP
jgi:acyl dehydratase